MSASLGSDKIEALKAILGNENVHFGSSVERFDPGFDSENLNSRLVVTPESVSQVQDLMKWCNNQIVSIVPLGGRTGLVGGGKSTPGQITLLTSRLQKILQIDPLGQFAIVESGVTLGALNAAAAALGLSAGIDLGARDSCTIGGMIATNAGGMEAFRNGSMRSRVLGLEAVMADGSVFDDLITVLKSNIGYDIKQLIIGSEGTLGIVTKAVIRLEPIHTRTATFLISFDSAKAAIQALRRIVGEADVKVLRSEIMWRSHFEVTATLLNFNSLVAFASSGSVFVIIETKLDRQDDFDGMAEKVLAGCAATDGYMDALGLKSEREISDVWRVREDWAVDRRYPGGLWYDVSVPHQQLDAYFNGLKSTLNKIDSSLILFVLGHLGDSNLHITVTGEVPPTALGEQISECIYEPIKGSGGSFSAEHGIGVEKQKTLINWGNPTRLKLMRSIKAAFDPNGLLNPRKILP